MGGGCACNNYLKENFFSPDSNIPLEIYQNKIEQININKEPNNANLIFSNILENPNEKNDINKRHSDFHNFEKKNFEKHLNMKNYGMKMSVNDWKNTSCNETNNKRISSNFNSSNFFGSNIGPATTSNKNNEIIMKEENNINTKIEKEKINDINQNNDYNKHNSIMNKIKKKEDRLKKAETNINCNLGENNYIFINISGSSLINNNENEKVESTTPKMMLGKENIDEIAKGKKKLFSHLCKNNLNEKVKKATNKNVFIHTFDMSKYNEEMLFIINKVRTEPESFIKDIDYLINNNIKKTEEGMFIVSYDVDEKIKLMENYIEIFENVKKILKEMAGSQCKLEKIKYNDELEIIFDETACEEDVENEDENSENDINNIPFKLKDLCEDNGIDMGEDEEKNQIKYNDNIKIIDYNDNDDQKENKILENLKIKKIKKNKKNKKRNINSILDLNDDKIANLILQKRKEIKNDYPHNIFKLSVIKDIKINILVQIGLEEFYKSESNDKKNNLKEIIFNPEYKNFGVSWTNEINRNFVSIACFA